MRNDDYRFTREPSFFDTRRDEPTDWNSTILKLVVGFSGLLLLAALLVPAIQAGREPGRRNQCSGNLKQIGVALQNYHKVFGKYPPAYTVDADGNQLHSWRTLLLPFLDEQRVFNGIDKKKPWHDSANATALKTPISVFRCPSTEFKLGQENYTTYLAIITPSSVLRARESKKQFDIKDSFASTMLVIEVDAKHAVPWMSPRDADERLVRNLLKNSSLAHGNIVGAVFVDGTVKFLGPEISDQEVRALISIAGNDDKVARAGLE